MAQEGGADLERLVADNTGPLLRGALAMGFSQADAEELVQDAFVSYLRARERFEGRSSVRTFLFGILYNKGSELSRKKRREAGHWLADRPKASHRRRSVTSSASAAPICECSCSARACGRFDGGQSPFFPHFDTMRSR